LEDHLELLVLLLFLHRLMHHFHIFQLLQHHRLHKKLLKNL
jgi:hypothetical protein